MNVVNQAMIETFLEPMMLDNSLELKIAWKKD